MAFQNSLPSRTMRSESFRGSISSPCIDFVFRCFHIGYRFLQLYSLMTTITFYFVLCGLKVNAIDMWSLSLITFFLSLKLLLMLEILISSNNSFYPHAIIYLDLGSILNWSRQDQFIFCLYIVRNYCILFLFPESCIVFLLLTTAQSLL